MIDKIFDGMDYAKRDKCNSVIGRIRKLTGKMRLALSETVAGQPVEAEINAGRWIANCPDCPGAEAVSPDEPIFYCFSCGNKEIGGKLREVIFPKDHKAIEAEILKRVVAPAVDGRDEIAKMLFGRPQGLPRSWTPTETIEDLREQNKKAGM
jgi:hypothetical protein